MVNLIAGSIFVCGVLLIVALFYILHLRSKIEALKGGQESWRQLALVNSDKAREATEDYETTSKALRETSLNVDAWHDDFRNLLIFLWGSPPLDRNWQDVINRISELHEAAQRKNQVNEGLKEIVVRQDAELKRHRDSLKAVNLSDSLKAEIIRLTKENDELRKLAAYSADPDDPIMRQTRASHGLSS